MNRSALVGLCGVVAGLAVGVVSSSRIAGAQARNRPQVQEAHCFYGNADDVNAWLGARNREGSVLAGGASAATYGLAVCVTRPAP